MKTIAVIDDDLPIGNMLQEVLQREGYGVLRAYSGTEALLLLSTQTPDLILLDLMMPGCSGEEVMQHISALGIPVIVVSAKVGIDDKVQLLLGGAVDYVTKPFDTKELLARIAVHLRTHQEAAKSRDTLCYSDIVLSTVSHTVTVCGAPVKLTKTEFAVLKVLMQNPKQAVAKSVILDRIFEDTPDCTQSSLKIHVSNLRKKLRAAGGKDYIEAVWGIGFQLSDTADQNGQFEP